ncbi:DUF1329 domain-containing protein [Ectopseudomonas guguanensis]|uniref:DUF1329 domain-containing protein n=1 Tax=Ectopseudomonas guguanensis TaxID=1198456 RepID=UPI003D35F9FA
MKLTSFIAGVALFASAPTFAAVSAEQAEALGTTLTPYGAEKSGNADGSIPEWQGGLPVDAGTVANGFRSDPYASEKPLFIIDASNYTQYQDKLSPGQVAMFKRYPETYKMPVFTTHRSAGLPDFVAADIRQNAVTAKTVEGGNGLENFRTAVPFPIPQNGLEVIWNHITRYRGGKLKRRSSSIVTQANGLFMPTSLEETFAYADQLKDYDPSKPSNVLFYYMSRITEPARQAGDVLLIHETLNQVKEPRMAWLYNSGQRRVRRAPQVAYDSPAQGADGLKTNDGLEIFNGSPDRYEWKLVGKRELYIPYNSYRVADPSLDYKTLITKGHMNQDHARYELHRVWEIEATLKPGERHIYAKRHMFLDEDTWTVAVADHYDGRGTLWRVAEAHLQYFYDVKTIFPTPEVIYDLIAGRYVATGLINERPNAYDFNFTANKQDYTPAALRNVGIR